MKSLEKIVGINVADVMAIGPSVKEVYSRLSRDYIEKTHPKLKILD
jgi:hypothetical protein